MPQRVVKIKDKILWPCNRLCDDEGYRSGPSQRRLGHVCHNIKGHSLRKVGQKEVRKIVLLAYGKGWSPIFHISYHIYMSRL